MPASFTNAGTGTFTIDGVEVGCQVTSFDPGLRDDTPDRTGSDLTACGTPIPRDEVEDYPARPTIGIVHDWTDGGVSRALAAAVGTEVAFTVELDSDIPGTTRGYSGTVIVPPVPDEWRPGKLQRADRLTFAATAFTGPTFA
jgi:hypothetical protein